MYGRDKDNKANDLLGKIKGLTKKAIYEQIKTGSIPKETLLNRCLVLIEAIQGITSVTARQRNRALKEAWEVYLLLTDFTGPERLDYDSTREVGLHMVDKNSIVEICQFLKDEPELKFNYLSDICGVDYTPEAPRFEVVYHLYSIPFKHRLRLKCKVAEGEKVPSVTGVWKTANWHEREAYD